MPERKSKRTAGPLDTSLGLLSRREHSVKELRIKLAARGHQGGVIETTLEDLVERDLLSDERFTQAFLRSRRERGQGPLKIRAQLMERGVNAELIETALAEAAVDWDRCAVAARRRRFGEAPPQDRNQMAKQARFLRGRGFSAAQVARALFSDNAP